ncbi:MAG TPA: APC family permease [Candidatus Omnitrophota bacterium]|nr:APC family permease [Candidatus Omnitrophota bacterium]HPS36306.1 APC family permease [Candidatus Omnitrophota bacterium]
MPNIPQTKKTARNVVLVTTAMLSFISFWKAAAIVLCDLASTAYYIGGIAEQAIGKAAPWFILGVMLFSYAVRAVYIESCGMFVRGGVYRVVKEAMGGTLAKLSVSALIFDYVLTGPISAVSAGQYLAGLFNTIFPHLEIPLHIPTNLFAIGFAIAVTLYFWWQNVKGIPESSEKALKIMGITTVMAILLITWSLLTLKVRGFHWPSFAPVFTKESLGWLLPFKDGIAPLGMIGITIAFGHSLLAMSGEESLAQVYREMEAPKLKNLEKAGFIIFIYSMLLTSLVSFFAVMIIPDAVRTGQYSDNLISGLTMHLIGPMPVRILFQAFVVFVGALILSGAVNTSIVGSNGVLNRLGEDGILPEALRRPHPRFGTSHRMIHLIVGLQILTILFCRGNIYILGEAYAFGVIWSFVFKSLAVLMLRYKNRSDREWKVPGNFRIFGIEIPMGLVAIFFVLFMTAMVNLLTKKVATISGSLFTLAFFIIFLISEKLNERHRAHPLDSKEEHHHIDRVNLNEMELLTPEACRCTKPKRIIVAVHSPKRLIHLERVLAEADPETTDVIGLTSKVGTGLFLEGKLDKPSPQEEELFTQVIATAEKVGRSVILLSVPTNDPYYVMARAAFDLKAQQLVVGKSEKFSPEVQMEEIAVAWGSVTPADEVRPLHVRVIWKDREYHEDI